MVSVIINEGSIKIKNTIKMNSKIVFLLVLVFAFMLGVEDAKIIERKCSEKSENDVLKGKIRDYEQSQESE